MDQHDEAMQGLPFKDRKARLVVLGVFQIIVGTLFAVAALLMIGMAMEQRVFPGYGIVRRVSVDRVIPGIALSSLWAVWFIWMGIGSVRARRWARALILVSSWLCLAYGILASVILLESIPHTFTRMVERGETSPSKIPAMWAEAIAFLATVSVVIPGLFILLYRGRDVQATCQSRDPQTRWTDKCPLPVLAISLVAAAEGLALFGTGISVWTYSHLRALSHGPLVAIADLLLASVSFYAAWGLYQQSIKAWWASLLVVDQASLRQECFQGVFARRSSWIRDSECARLGTQGIRDDCFAILGRQAAHTRACLKVFDTKLRKDCLFAAARNDASGCLALNDSAEAKRCVAEAGFSKTTDISVCSLLPESRQRDCARRVSLNREQEINNAR
jgi:hypothetical protein